MHIYIVEINTHLLLNNTGIQFALSSRNCFSINIKQTGENVESEKICLLMCFWEGLSKSGAMSILSDKVQ